MYCFSILNIHQFKYQFPISIKQSEIKIIKIFYLLITYNQAQLMQLDIQGENYRDQQLAKNNYMNLQQEQNLPDINNFGENYPEKTQGSFSYWILAMIACQYFLQGVVLSIPGTMPYIYPILPNYNVLSIFSLSTIAFSLKFITAPFLEKYQLSLITGKRKSWIVVSLFSVTGFLLLSSFYTQQSQSFLFAFILIFAILFLSTQDISLDAVSIKQLRSPAAASIVQGVSQQLGGLLGGLALLKLTSSQFSSSILGTTQPITNIALLIRIIALLNFILGLSIGIFFNETILQQERIIKDLSFCEIIKKYKIFLQIRSSQCRLVLILILFRQGFNFFSAGYDFELVNAGFSKNSLNTISNIISVPIMIICLFIGCIANYLGVRFTATLALILTHVFYVYIYFVFPMHQITVFILSFFLNLFDTFIFILMGMQITSFPVTGVSGMQITMMSSSYNLGNQTAPHLKLIGMFGWKTMAGIGLILQIGLTICFWFSYDWMKSGNIGVNGQIVQQIQNKQQKEQDCN